MIILRISYSEKLRLMKLQKKIVSLCRIDQPKRKNSQRAVVVKNSIGNEFVITAV